MHGSFIAATNLSVLSFFVMCISTNVLEVFLHLKSCGYLSFFIFVFLSRLDCTAHTHRVCDIEFQSQYCTSTVRCNENRYFVISSTCGFDSCDMLTVRNSAKKFTTSSL